MPHTSRAPEYPAGPDLSDPARDLSPADVRHAYTPGRFTLEPCYLCKGAGRRLEWDQELHPCDRCDGSGLRPRRSPTWEEAAHRWPRLLRCAQWVACLSGGEASTALRDYIGNRTGAYRTGGCEAVAHFGGPAAVVRAAIVNRAHVRAILGGRFYRERTPTE